MTLAAKIKEAARWVHAEKFLELQLPLILGDWYFVVPGLGLNTNTGLTIAEAFADIQTAYTAVENGDGIAVLSYGTTTAHTTSYLVTGLSWTKSNITVVGIAAPTRYAGRARISSKAVTGQAITNLLTISGANNRFYNLHIANFGTTGTGCLSVTGDRNYFHNIHCIGGGGVTSASVADMDLSLSGDENTFDDCIFGSDTFDKENNAGFSMQFISGAQRNRFYHCEFNQMRAAGTTAGVINHAGGDSITRHQIFDDCFFNVYRDGNVPAEAFVVIGTVPNNGHILFRGNCERHGFADWCAVAMKDRCFTNGVDAAVDGAGGIMIAANPS